MYTGAVRRRLGADDDFFEAGNLQRALLCKLSVYREEEEEEDIALGESQLRYECMFQGCGARFSSLKRVSALSCVWSSSSCSDVVFLCCRICM